jgi:hypothetical protein
VYYVHQRHRRPACFCSVRERAAMAAAKTDTVKPGIFATMAASSIGSALARLPCHPIDTIKAKLQAQHGARVVANTGAANVGPIAAARAVMRSEGLRGFYRGIGVTVVGSVPAGCLYFTSYEMLRDQMMANNPMSRWPVTVSLTAGFGAEAISCVMWVPIDVTKERLQVQSVLPKGSRRYTSSAHAFTTILQREGLGGLYRGYAATLQSFGPFSALYFATYEQSKATVTVLHGGHLDRRCGTAAQPLRGAVSNVNLCAANHSADFAASCPCHTCWHVPRSLVLWQLGCHHH